MIREKIKLGEDTRATLTTYVLDDGELRRAGMKHPAVIVCPGGGYTYVSANEGEPVALLFNKAGYHAFVLDYSVKIDNPFPKALTELARSIKLIRENADAWRVDADKIAVCGFSAGGNLALSLGVDWNKDFLKEAVGAIGNQLQPNALILGYAAVCLDRPDKKPSAETIRLIEEGKIPDFRGPSIKEILIGRENPSEESKSKLNLLNYVGAQVPPCFIWNTDEDEVVPPSDSMRLCLELDRYRVPVEYHLYRHGAHGLSLADNTVKDDCDIAGTHVRYWQEEVLAWLGETFK